MIDCLVAYDDADGSLQEVKRSFAAVPRAGEKILVARERDYLRLVVEDVVWADDDAPPWLGCRHDVRRP